MLSVGPWKSLMVVPSVAGPPRNAEDTSPPQVTPLTVCDVRHRARVPATAVVRAPCSTATTEREMAEPCGHCDAFGVGWRHLQRYGPYRL